MVRIYKVKKVNSRKDLMFTPRNILDTPKKINLEIDDEEFLFIN